MKNCQAGPVTGWEADLHDGIPWQNPVKEAVGFHNPGDRSSRNCRKGERESLYQSLWSQGIARSQYRKAFCGTGLVSLPGLLLPPLPLRGTSHHPCPLVFNSSKLCCPSPVCSPSCASAHRVAPSQLALFSEEARGLNLAFKAPHTLVPSCCPSRMPLAAWHLTCQPL